MCGIYHRCFWWPIFNAFIGLGPFLPPVIIMGTVRHTHAHLWTTLKPTFLLVNSLVTKLFSSEIGKIVFRFATSIAPGQLAVY